MRTILKYIASDIASDGNRMVSKSWQLNPTRIFKILYPRNAYNKTTYW